MTLSDGGYSKDSLPGHESTGFPSWTAVLDPGTPEAGV